MFVLRFGLSRWTRDRVGGAVKSIDGATEERVDTSRLLGREVRGDGKAG
jgi:hypothetical protein